VVLLSPPSLGAGTPHRQTATQKHCFQTTPSIEIYIKETE
jgi:hypothetical protein